MTPTFALLAALALSLQPERYDTVILSNGGVLRGTVVEDIPGADLVLLMPDGTTRKIPRAEVVRVDWAIPAAQPPLPSPFQEQPPRSPPPQVPPERGPLELGLWFSGAFPAGDLDASGLTLSSAFSPLFVLGFEASLRAADPLELGLYLRLGGGESRSPINDLCRADGGWCDSLDFGAGAFSRWSFAPRALVNPWVQVGAGFEYLSAFNDWVSIDYTGWEVGAWAGLDVNTGPLGALGFFGGARWGEFVTGVPHGGLPMPWGGAAGHWWIDVGMRLAWWP